MATTPPLDCPEYKWASAGVPYDESGGPPRRYLVLCNGPENIIDGHIKAGEDHTNVYWGLIPFEGTDLRLRLFVAHILDRNASFKKAEIRFCLGIRGAGGSDTGVKIVRKDSTVGHSLPGAYEYIDPCKECALSHLGQRWKTTLKPGETIPVPDEAQSGDVTDLAVTMSKESGPDRYGDMVSELDLKADQPLKGRSLIVRFVLRTSAGGPMTGGLGVCREEQCCDDGAGERGWWPQADIWVQSDPAKPVTIKRNQDKPYACYFRLCERGGLDWGMFNVFTPNKQASWTNNKLDRFGTKNSGLWGVNVLYRVYYQSGDPVRINLDTNIAGLHQAMPGGHVVAGPFKDPDQPWDKYVQRKLRYHAADYVDRRSKTDFDLVGLGRAGTADKDVNYFEYFIANIGNSTLPTAWVMMNPPKPED